jgi:hypothetical protein
MSIRRTSPSSIRRALARRNNRLTSWPRVSARLRTDQRVRDVGRDGLDRQKAGRIRDHARPRQDARPRPRSCRTASRASSGPTSTKVPAGFGRHGVIDRHAGQRRRAGKRFGKPPSAGPRLRHSSFRHLLAGKTGQVAARPVALGHRQDRNSRVPSRNRCSGLRAGRRPDRRRPHRDPIGHRAQHPSSPAGRAPTPATTSAQRVAWLAQVITKPPAPSGTRVAASSSSARFRCGRVHVLPLSAQDADLAPPLDQRHHAKGQPGRLPMPSSWRCS